MEALQRPSLPDPPGAPGTEGMENASQTPFHKGYPDLAQQRLHGLAPLGQRPRIDTIAWKQSFVLRGVRQAILQQGIRTGGVGLLRLSQHVSRASRNLHRHCPQAYKRVLLDSGGPFPFTRRPA